MDGRGVRLLGSEVGRGRDATSIRVRNDELSITDGPFAEAKEQMAGFDLIECADLDKMIEVASKHPVARFGTIDIRPSWGLSERGGRSGRPVEPSGGAVEPRSRGRAQECSSSSRSSRKWCAARTGSWSQSASRCLSPDTTMAEARSASASR
jgi:hypothetical protein